MLSTAALLMCVASSVNHAATTPASNNQRSVAACCTVAQAQFSCSVICKNALDSWQSISLATADQQSQRTHT
jgi:hypothetical protein